MSPFGFEPTIPASQRPQTYALDRVATGTGHTIRRTHYKNEPVNAKLPQEICWSWKKRLNALYEQNWVLHNIK
jgi:hypothetical protein